MSESDATKEGFVETYAGNGISGMQNGHRLSASFSSFWSCCVAPNGGVYVGDFGNHVIRLVEQSGVTSTYAGTGLPGFADGPRRTAAFHSPAGLCLTSTGELLISDKNNNRIRQINAQEMVITIAGSGQSGDEDGPCQTASFHNPIGLCESPIGILVADWFNHKVRLVANGLVSTFAGTGVQGYANGPKALSLFHHPVGVCVSPIVTPGRTKTPSNPSTSTASSSISILPSDSPTGGVNVFIADRNNHRIRVVRPDGEVESYSGTERGFADGPKEVARFTFPWSLCMTPLGELLVADEYNHRIRVVDPLGSVYTLAGNGEKDFRDGQRETSSFAFPACVSLSPQGEVFVADRDNYRLRRIKVGRWNHDAARSDTKLSLAGLREADFLADLNLELHSSGASWKLHSPIITMRCPQLLEPVTQAHIKKLPNIPVQTINALIDFIYDNHIPFNLSLVELCDLDVLATTIQLTELVHMTRLELAQALRSSHPSDELIALLGHVVVKCGCPEDLVDLVVVALRTQRAQVALKLMSFSDWLAPTDPRFLQIVGKIMGDFPLKTVESQEQIVRDGLESVLRELYENFVLPVASASSSSVATSSSSSSSDLPILSAATASSSSGASNPPPTWRIPDFTISLESFELRCHKWIVCGRWSYLRNVVAFGGAEAQQSKLEIPCDSGFTPSLLQSFVDYLYTNRVDQFATDEECLTMLKLAKQFRLVDGAGKDVVGFGLLLDKCRSSLIQPFQLDNCIGIYKNTIEYGNEDQQMSARSFIIRNMQRLIEDPKQCAELQGLGTGELVRFLHTLSRSATVLNQ